jgi:outer membrane biosynthesis protein TonB
MSPRPLLAVAFAASVVACTQQPPHVYPDDAWNQGTEGDVVVEKCPTSQDRVVSGPTELKPAAMKMAAASPKPASCHATTYSFRKHPTPDDVARLLTQEDTVLVTRGLERPRKVSCPPSPTYPDEGHRDGESVVVLTVEPTGQVGELQLKKTNGSGNEALWIAWLKGVHLHAGHDRRTAVPGALPVARRLGQSGP